MIRDEFKNADKKTIAKKANKKLTEMGERAYYTTKIAKYADIFKPTRISTLFAVISFTLIALVYALPLMVGEADYSIPTFGWIVIALAGIFIVWAIVWFAFLAPMLRKKVDFWKEEIEKLNKDYVSKFSSK